MAVPIQTGVGRSVSAVGCRERSDSLGVRTGVVRRRRPAMPVDSHLGQHLRFGDAFVGFAGVVCDA